MGKKSKFKKMRRLANQMPELKTTVLKGSVVDAKELMQAGVKEVDGKAIGHGKTYRKIEPVAQTVNHHRRMKKIYNKYGPDGVGAYMGAVDDFVKSKQKKTDDQDPL
jgi:hypothetical protein